MEMRLGKTLCTIRGLKSAKRVLVVCPMVAMWAWKRELELENVVLVAELTGSKYDRIISMQRGWKWNVINYEGLLACPDILEEQWDAVVLDECRRIANPQAKTTKALLKWSKENPFVKKVILSGNPAPESPLEYFTQMKFLNGEFMRCENYWQFRNYYFRELAPHEWVPRSQYIGKIKESVHGNAFVLTRHQAGLKNTKVYEVRRVRLGPEARRTYVKIVRDFVRAWKGREVDTTKWVPVQFLWLQQIASGFIGRDLVDRAKVRETIDLLQGELKDEQVIVWFRFNSGITAITESLEKQGISYGTLQGSVSREGREIAINRFRNGQVRVLLCQIKVAKEAIDLSNASTSIYFTNSHSLDERMQSEDRILNPAKKDPLLYIDIVTEDTVDEHTLIALRDKRVESRFFMSKLLQQLAAR